MKAPLAPSSVVCDAWFGRESSPAFDAATAIRDFIRARQHVIRCECDRMHKIAPIQVAAWLLVMQELGAVADVCNSLNSEAFDAVPNV